VRGKRGDEEKVKGKIGGSWARIDRREEKREKAWGMLL